MAKAQTIISVKFSFTRLSFKSKKLLFPALNKKFSLDLLKGEINKYTA